MLPSVSKKEVVKYLSLMDFALVNLRKSDTFLNVIPSKIFEAAAMQKPILLGLEGETKKLIQEYNAGLCFEPENESDFLYKIDKIIDENNQNSLKLGCLNLAKDFDRNLIATKMLLDIKK
jgi:glycosyltransferase involved in cell wall biosynthesis